MLVKRFEYEKRKLGEQLGPERATLDASVISCCLFDPEILHQKLGFDSWLESLPINDSSSWFLDLNLLEELSQIPIVDHKEMQLVRSVTSFCALLWFFLLLINSFTASFCANCLINKLFNCSTQCVYGVSDCGYLASSMHIFLA